MWWVDTDWVKCVQGSLPVVGKIRVEYGSCNEGTYNLFMNVEFFFIRFEKNRIISNLVKLFL